MRTIKYHLALTDNEYSLIINSLNNLRNDLIAQGRYTFRRMGKPSQAIPKAES